MDEIDFETERNFNCIRSREDVMLLPVQFDGIDAAAICRVMEHEGVSYLLPLFVSLEPAMRDRLTDREGSRAGLHDTIQ
jgi:hypothetical protein